MPIAAPGHNKAKGQRPRTREKYREAIEACDSEEYLHLNIAEIARLFHLGPTALSAQLRTHYPDIIPRREAQRQKRGLADNRQRGARKFAAGQYAKAIKMLADTDLTIEEVARRCNVPYTGLRHHILFWNKDLERQREQRRLEGQQKPKIGTLAGNGQLRKLPAEIEQKYARGVELYRTTSLPVTEIARQIGVNVDTFRHHLRTWHRRLMFERRGARLSPQASDRASFDGTKRYSRATAEKYAQAIDELKTSDASVEAVAKRFGFVPEVFRTYLKEHEPELFESLGMTTLPNGRQVLKRSYLRYLPAIEDYATTADTLKTIAERHNIPYNSLAGFIRRNLPDLIEKKKSK